MALVQPHDVLIEHGMRERIDASTVRRSTVYAVCCLWTDRRGLYQKPRKQSSDIFNSIARYP